MDTVYKDVAEFLDLVCLNNDFISLFFSKSSLFYFELLLQFKNLVVTVFRNLVEILLNVISNLHLRSAGI